MANMTQNNMANDATQLRISILEKQLQQQSQTSKEILNHLKNTKRSDTPQHNHHNTSLNQQPHSFEPEDIVDLTTHSPEDYKNSSNIPRRGKKQKLHWYTNIAQTYQYNHLYPPNQMLPNSTTLNPLLRTKPQTSNISQTPFQSLLSFQQPNTPPNPFISSIA